MKFLAPILFFLICSYIPSSAPAQIKMMSETENAETEKVKLMKDGGFKRLCIYRYDIDEVDWQTDSTLITEMIYESQEKKFTEITGEPAYSKSILKLNGDNKILSREIFDSRNSLTGKTLYNYNSKGQLEKREIFLGSTKAFDEIYDYDNNNLEKMKYLTPDGMLFSYSKFNTDKWGNIDEEIKYNNNDDIEYRYMYTYDADSKCLEERIILGDKNTTIVSYNYVKGRLNDKITRDAKGKVLSKISYTYDGNGKIETEINETNSARIIKTIGYENGLIRRIKIVDESDVSDYILKYFYE